METTAEAVTEQPWYDTREGIQAAIKKGLPGLKELAEARSKAGYKRGERMGTWVVLGLFWIDTCGNWAKMDETSGPYFRRRSVKVPDVMDTDEFHALYPGVSMSAEHRHCLPPLVEVCDRCLRGWEMRDIHDYYPPRRDDGPHRHERCQHLYVIEDAQALFGEILSESNVPHASMRAIPNEYYDDPTFFGPWFIVDTEWGPLRIGYRKRVINIDWSDTRIAHDGNVLFKDEDVTKDRSMIHAWGKDKAIEYLQMLLT